jgi:hypothetical protein
MLAEADVGQAVPDNCPRQAQPDLPERPTFTEETAQYPSILLAATRAPPVGWSGRRKAWPRHRRPVGVAATGIETDTSLLGGCPMSFSVKQLLLEGNFVPWRKCPGPGKRRQIPACLARGCIWEGGADNKALPPFTARLARPTSAAAGLKIASVQPLRACCRRFLRCEWLVAFASYACRVWRPCH